MISIQRVQKQKPLAVHECEEKLSNVQFRYFMEAGNLRNM
jgi:hypothetical protein